MSIKPNVSFQIGLGSPKKNNFEPLNTVVKNKLLKKGNADAGLAASIFHCKEIAIPDLKSYLKGRNIPIR